MQNTKHWGKQSCSGIFMLFTKKLLKKIIKTEQSNSGKTE